MKLSELKGEDAIEVLADIIEPAALIMGDAKIKAIYDAKEPIIKLVAYILKEHNKEALIIAARLDGVEESEVNLLTLPKVIIEAFNDPLLASFFPLAVKDTPASVSGLRTANTTEDAK